MKHTKHTHIKVGVASLCALLAVLAQKADAQNYFTTAVANNGTYSWDGASWGTSSSGPFTSDWAPGSFARFLGGSGDSYVVTVNASENVTGMYEDVASGTLTINDAGNGTGSIDITGGVVQGFLAGNSSTATASIAINVPIVGNGGIAPEEGGSLYLDGVNTYSGGTAMGLVGNTLTYFNNGSAFGTGGITLNRTGGSTFANFSTLLSTGGTPITFANSFSTVSGETGVNTGLNFASGANTPVTSSGNWSLGTVNIDLRNSGGSTAPLTLSGSISGSGNVLLSANGTGNNTIFSGINTYTGTTTLLGATGTGAGSGAITLTLGAANTIASSSSIIMAGGTLNPGGFAQAMTGTLGLTASSTIDFSAGSAAVSFANSSAGTWTGVLNLLNWSYGDLQFGSDNTGLTSGQLADIDFNGVSGEAALDPNGFLIQLPEPSTWALGLAGLGVLYAVRRRTA